MEQPLNARPRADERFVLLSDGSRVRTLLHPASTASPRRFLLIHGNPASLEDWDQLVPLLTPAGDVLRIDLPGFGESTRPPSQLPSDLALPRLAEVVLELTSSLGWTEPFVVVGHSHGGGVAQLLAARHPDRVCGIVLLGTLAFPAHLNYHLLPLPGIRQLMQLGSVLLRQPGWTWFKRIMVRQVLGTLCSPERPSDSQVAQELERLTRAPESLLSMVDVSLGGPCLLLRQLAPKIQCPTLIIHGQKDAVVPLRCAQALHDEMAAARGMDAAARPTENPAGRTVQLTVLPDAGHMLGIFQAQQCAHLIHTFFQPAQPGP